MKPLQHLHFKVTPPPVFSLASKPRFGTVVMINEGQYQALKPHYEDTLKALNGEAGFNPKRWLWPFRFVPRWLNALNGKPSGDPHQAHGAFAAMLNSLLPDTETGQDVKKFIGPVPTQTTTEPEAFQLHPLPLAEPALHGGALVMVRDIRPYTGAVWELRSHYQTRYEEQRAKAENTEPATRNEIGVEVDMPFLETVQRSYADQFIDASRPTDA